MFQQQSYNTINEFLKGLLDFASSNGWVVVYDKIDVNEQLGLRSANGGASVAIGRLLASNDTIEAVSRYDYLESDYVSDVVLAVNIVSSFENTNHKYYGHPGQFCVRTSNNCQVNDLIGVFTNAWFFTNSPSTYIHVVLQMSTGRFTSFTFGELDGLGTSTPAVGYAGGSYYVWWNNDADPGRSVYAPNDVSDTYHDHFAFTIRQNNDGRNVSIPVDVISASLLHNPAPLVTSQLLKHFYERPLTYKTSTETRSGFLMPLDGFQAIANQTTTGGVPLHTIEMIYKTTDDESQGDLVHLGIMPDIRIVNIDGLAPAETISFGGESWQVFPWKKQGLYENTRFGSNPLLGVNTLNYGIAIKVIA